MKLFEVANTNAGHWEFKTDSSGVRHWKPIFFPDPGETPFLPFTNAGSRKGDPTLYSVTAYDLLPGVGIQSLPEEHKGHFLHLLDALKLRSSKDVIDPDVFKKLLEACATSVISKAQLRKQGPNRIVIVTPGSTSSVAESFAKVIQHNLKVKDTHTFLGHFGKRDADDYVLDVMDNETLPEVTRNMLLARLKGYNKAEPGTKIQAKSMRQGDRDDARKHGIHMMDVTKDIELPQKVVPYLIIVDDNTQGGTTYKSVAALFKQHTGIDPGVVINVSMFKL